MSSKDKVKAIIDKLPDAKVDYLLILLQGMEIGEDIDDDLFCEKLYQEYLADTDPEKHSTIPIEELAKDLGVTL